jgi:hypothetical protein
MKKVVAERRLQFSIKGSHNRGDLSIKVGEPYVVVPGSVNFDVDDQTGACEVEISGLPKRFHDVVYGADTLQALQLATNIDPLLRRLEDRYDFYFPTGEPYFE